MQYIIFDFDGTIADTYPLAKEIFKKIKNKYSDKEFDFDDIKKYELSDLLKRYKMPIYKFLLLVYEMKKEMQKNEVNPFLNIEKMIKEIKKDCKIGIVSSNSKDNISKFLEKNRLKDYFDFVYTDTSFFGKNISLERLCKKYNLEKDEVIYVGDETRDVKACKKAGIKIIATTWGFSSKKLLEKQNPDYIAESPDEILKIIRQNLK